VLIFLSPKQLFVSRESGIGNRFLCIDTFFDESRDNKEPRKPAPPVNNIRLLFQKPMLIKSWTLRLSSVGRKYRGSISIITSPTFKRPTEVKAEDKKGNPEIAGITWLTESSFRLYLPVAILPQTSRSLLPKLLI